MRCSDHQDDRPARARTAPTPCVAEFAMMSAVLCSVITAVLLSERAKGESSIVDGVPRQNSVRAQNQ